MKTINIIIISLFSLLTLNAYAQKGKAEKDMEAWRYEIEVVNTGATGTYLIKVWTYSKKPNVAIEQAKKNAVHGIIFRGFAGKDRIPGQQALTNNPNLENERKDFFEPFFEDGGKYLKFVNITNDGAVGEGDRMKIGKEYKVGLTVSVNVTELRKDLENADIIKKLSSGF